MYDGASSAAVLSSAAFLFGAAGLAPHPKLLESVYATAQKKRLPEVQAVSFNKNLVLWLLT